MKARWSVLYAALAVPLLCVGGCGYRKSEDHVEKTRYIPLSAEEDKSDGSRVANTLGNDPAVIEAYNRLKAASQTENSQTQTDAIRLLSEHPLPEIITLLVEKSHEVLDPRYDGLDDQAFPAYAALIKIGQPALKPMYDRFKTTANGAERLTLLNVLLKMQGPDNVLRCLTALEKAQPNFLESRGFAGWQEYIRCSRESSQFSRGK